MWVYLCLYYSVYMKVENTNVFVTFLGVFLINYVFTLFCYMHRIVIITQRFQKIFYDNHFRLNNQQFYHQRIL